MTIRWRAGCLVSLALSVAGCASFSAGADRPPTRERIMERGPTRVELMAEGAAPMAVPLQVPGQPGAFHSTGQTMSAGAARPVEMAQGPDPTPIPAPVPSLPSQPPSRERRVIPPLRAGTEETTQAPPDESPQRLIVFNFDNADVEVVIQAAAEIVGFNYVLAPAARGRKVTIQTIGKIANNDVFNVLLTILDVNGLAAVKSGNLYRIIPKEGAPQSSIRTVVGREADPSRSGDEVLTQLIPLQYINAADAVNLLRPFVPQQGGISAHRETNLLIITDTAANIRRVLDIVKLVDVEMAVDELQIIPLRHSDAQELAQLLNQMFSTGRLRSGVGAVAPGAPTPPPVPGAPVPPAIPGSPTTP